MCRLFGFRSVIQSAVHRSLVEADNALAVQSQEHRDGWGVAWYLAGTPHVIKGTSPAIEDAIFSRLSGIVASETVLAHLRLATAGEVNVLNSHPFQHGRWVFAHNGKIAGFARQRETLRAMLPPTLRRFVLGDTDSELLFYLFVAALTREAELHRPGTPIDAIGRALAEVVQLVQALPESDEGPSLLTFLVTDGQSMVALRMGKPLLFSTHKQRCPDRDACAWLDASCERAGAGRVNHLIVSSEVLQGNNVWISLQDGEMVGVDWRMMLHRGTVAEGLRPVAAPRQEVVSTSDRAS